MCSPAIIPAAIGAIGGIAAGNFLGGKSSQPDIKSPADRGSAPSVPETTADTSRNGTGTSAADQALIRARMAQAKRNQGVGSTVKTSPLGAVGTATTAQKTLLGG